MIIQNNFTALKFYIYRHIYKILYVLYYILSIFYNIYNLDRVVYTYMKTTKNRLRLLESVGDQNGLGWEKRGINDMYIAYVQIGKK